MNDTQNKPQDTKAAVVKTDATAVKEVTPAVSKDATAVKTEAK